MVPRAGSPEAEGLVPPSVLRRQEAQEQSAETPRPRRKTSRPAAGEQLSDQRA